MIWSTILLLRAVKCKLTFYYIEICKMKKAFDQTQICQVKPSFYHSNWDVSTQSNILPGSKWSLSTQPSFSIFVWGYNFQCNFATRKKRSFIKMKEPKTRLKKKSKCENNKLDRRMFPRYVYKSNTIYCNLS